MNTTIYIPQYHGAGATDSFAIQAVIVKKPITLTEAKAKAVHILKKQKLMHRETASSFRFRNVAKTKFVKGTFKSKKVNPSITLVFGELKPEFAHLRGEGIWDWIKDKASNVVNYFKPKLDGFNNTSTRTLKAYGDKTITNMFIMRTPIQGMLNTALNAISFGKWNSLREKYAFDKLYHLSLVVEVENKKVIVEKNATVNINTNYQHASTSEIQNVAMGGKQLTLYQLVENGRKSVGDTTFFKYNAFNENGGTNCQRFIQLLLEANGLLTAEANNFLMQDLSQLKEELPSYVRNTAQVATDLGAIANRITGGKRKRKLRGGVIDKDTYLKRQSKGVYPASMSYEQYADHENENRRRIDNEIGQLAEKNKQYQEYLKEHPEEEEVMCNYDENLQPKKSRTTRAECDARHQAVYKKQYDESPFGKIVNGLTSVADFVVDKIPLPGFVKQVYRKLGPPTSKYYESENLFHKFTGKGIDHYLRYKFDNLYLPARSQNPAPS